MHYFNLFLCYFLVATPAANSVEVPKEPEFVIFASYLHPPNTPMRHSVLKEMVSGVNNFTSLLNPFCSKGGIYKVYSV